MNINFKLIARNLLHSKRNTIINIVGLTIAFACAFAVIVWIKNESGYDKHLPEAGRTYRLTFETTISGNTLHFARCDQEWITQVPAAFPQIEELVRLAPYRHTAIKIGENKFYTDRAFATDSNFFKVFGIDLLSGDKEDLLKEPFSAVISGSVASKCFGNGNPVGQILMMSGEYDTKMTPFTIKGVMKDSPVNSHIHFDILTSFAKPQEPAGWSYIYLLLKKGTRPDDILAGLPAFLNEIYRTDVQKNIKPYLQRITDIHLFSNKDREVEINGNITRIYLFASLALVMLLISWVNFYNLNKARILVLKKQIHIQRITGSNSRLIIAQYIIESGICVIIAALLSFNLLEIPGKSLLGFRLLPDGFDNLLIIWPVVLTILIISVIAGGLPAIMNVVTQGWSFSGDKPNSYPSSGRFSSYGILMTVQFCLSIVMLVTAITIYQQKEFILSQSMGKMSSDILVFKKQSWAIRFKYNAFRDKALQNPLIKSFSASMEEPGGETLDALQVESPLIDENHKNNPLFVLSVEDNFLDFFNIPLIAGRNFSPYNPNRKGEDYILNEAALKKLGWSVGEAVGRPIKVKFDTPDIFYGGTVVGIVRDFNFTSVRQEIKPYILFQKPIFYLTFLVKVDSARKNEAIAGLQSIWEQELPEYPFQYEFLDDLYKTTYQKELSQAKLTSIFSILAVVIICLGLFSVTSVMVARRTKEIGIRKVNGAKVADILFMLNSAFIKWLLIAFVIGCPIAWYTMHKWLENFVYRTEIKWWVFAVAGIIVLVVALVTVSLQSLKSATRNPVKALRYE